MTISDRLEHARSRPLVVVDAVGAALRDAVAWRVGGGAAPDATAFVAAAIAAARLRLDADGSDPAERSRTLAIVQRTAKRFAASKLWRRLMTVPPVRFVRTARTRGGPDAIVRDRRGRLHAIVISARSDGLDAARIATAVAAATPLPIAQRLLPLSIHVYSLATGVRHAFDRELSPARTATAVRVA